MWTGRGPVHENLRLRSIGGPQSSPSLNEKWKNGPVPVPVIWKSSWKTGLDQTWRDYMYVNVELRFVTLSFHKIYLTVPCLLLRLLPYQISTILLKLTKSPLTYALQRHESDGDHLAISLGTMGMGNCSAQQRLANQWSLTILVVRPMWRRLIKGWALTIRLVSLSSSLNPDYWSTLHYGSVKQTMACKLCCVSGGHWHRQISMVIPTTSVLPTTTVSWWPF
jgi:hypothetical protein